jgi:hypothetical protein
MTTCKRCGREHGRRHDQCYDDAVECLALALARAERERDEARLESWRAQTDRSAALVIALDAAREADALRELAWKWCIAAKIWSEDAVSRAEWDEPPIESLGPVPIPDESIDRAIAWLVRDAVRRGAKLEGT